MVTATLDVTPRPEDHNPFSSLIIMGHISCGYLILLLCSELLHHAADLLYARSCLRSWLSLDVSCIFP